jgi:precorrin-2 dehydrogenase / sirohydrochlorin ferrochelatase
MTRAPGVEVFPIGLVVAGRRCLVVGGGAVAARKIASLLRCGASVTVVAPEVHEAVAALAEDGSIAAIDGEPLDVQLRPYRAGEAGDYRLVVAATGDPAVDRAVHHDAEAAGVWVNSADDLDHCSAVLPAVHRDGAVSVAVSTGGTSPALASWLRDRLARVLGPGLGDLAELLAEGRAALQARGRPTSTVDWRGLLDGPLPDLVARGRIDEARQIIHTAINSPLQ